MKYKVLKTFSLTNEDVTWKVRKIIPIKTINMKEYIFYLFLTIFIVTF